MRRLRAPVLTLLLACGVVLLAAHPAFAAEEGGDSSELTSVFQWLNFAIVAGALVWVLAKKAPGYFAERSRQIISAIQEAANLKAQADAQRREAEQRLANLPAEINQMRAAARRDAEAQVERIHTAARHEAAKIEHSAHMEVEAARRTARTQLRAFATRLSIEYAEALLRREMTPAAEDGMFASFVGELARPGGPAGQAGRPN